MTDIALNQLPQAVLQALQTPQAVLHCSNDTEGVLCAPTAEPAELRPAPAYNALDAVRRAYGLYALTLTVMRLTPALAQAAGEHFPQGEVVTAELEAVLARQPEMYVVYCVAHANQRPLEEYTVFIGGDCHREDRGTLEAVVGRTRDLARAMLRKSQVVFPDIPALHGGKKGEWLVIGPDGAAMTGLSEQALVALGALILPQGITFLNRYKAQRAAAHGRAAGFAAANHVRPDTVSPDVLSGRYWETLWRTWLARGYSPSYFTCQPAALGGPRVPSSYPTGYGVAATAMRLAAARFPERSAKDLRFVLEALGGVAQSAIEGLVERYGVPAENILAFDERAEACTHAQARWPGLQARVSRHDAFYEGLPVGALYDVWINNGVGDNTTPDHIISLLNAGVRLFCGGANDFLEVTTKAETLGLIFAREGWAWPDEATSGGGWTLAVVDLYRRAQGVSSGDAETTRQILDTITTRNEQLVGATLAGVGAITASSGAALWNGVSRLIDTRVAETQARVWASEDVLSAADTRNWHL